MTNTTSSYVHGVSDKPLIGETIGRLFDRISREHAAREALVVTHQRIRWTYGQLRDTVDRLAAGLVALGLEPGERVGIWAPNCAEWVVTQFATAKAGLILVNINPAYRLAELEAERFSEVRIDGARIAVEGFGSVGKHAARFLCERGARLVAASDTRGCIHNAKGLDVGALIAFKEAGNSVAQYADGRALDCDALLDVECDIWIPAARPDVLTADSAKRLKARIVAEGANIPATPEAERLLAERGVLVLPDFIANAGGVICAALELNHLTESQAMSVLEEKIRHNVGEVLALARANRTLPRDAAVDLARAHQNGNVVPQDFVAPSPAWTRS